MNGLEKWEDPLVVLLHVVGLVVASCCLTLWEEERQRRKYWLMVLVILLRWGGCRSFRQTMGGWHACVPVLGILKRFHGWWHWGVGLVDYQWVVLGA